jgi:hypothetical protein
VGRKSVSAFDSEPIEKTAAAANIPQARSNSKSTFKIASKAAATASNH